MAVGDEEIPEDVRAAGGDTESVGDLSWSKV